MNTKNIANAAETIYKSVTIRLGILPDIFTFFS